MTWDKMRWDENLGDDFICKLTEIKCKIIFIKTHYRSGKRVWKLEKKFNFYIHVYLCIVYYTDNYNIYFNS